jgi:hypothetical protein
MIVCDVLWVGTVRLMAIPGTPFTALSAIGAPLAAGLADLVGVLAATIRP